MKTIFLITALLAANLVFANTPPVQPEVKPEIIQADTSAIPDTLWVTVDGEQVGIPTKDAQLAAGIISELVKENKDNLPKNFMGWVALIVGIFFSARGTVLVTAGKGVYAFLEIFLKKTLNIVAFVAGLLSAGITLILGKGSFDWQTFMTLWGIVSFLAVYVYEAIKKKPVVAK